MRKVLIIVPAMLMAACSYRQYDPDNATTYTDYWCEKRHREGGLFGGATVPSEFPDDQSCKDHYRQIENAKAK